MKRRLGLFLLICFAFAGSVFAEKVIELPDVLKANQIVICQNRLFVADQVTVYIYNLKDFQLIKKFGKRGEGPEEFMNSISGIFEGKDYILISSQNKASFFTADGTFIKEKKAKSGLFSGRYQEAGENYVGISSISEAGALYFGIFLFDHEFKSIKELARFKFMENGKFNFLNMMRMISVFTYKDKIYMAGDKGFAVNILDSNAKLLNTITREYTPRKVTDKDKETIKALFKRNIPGSQWEVFKDRIIFDDYFPVILSIQVADDIIYISTWKQQGDRFEIFLYKLDGSFIKKKMVRLVMQAGQTLAPYPTTFHKGQLYQLIEDEDDEVWKLHITELK